MADKKTEAKLNSQDGWHWISIRETYLEHDGRMPIVDSVISGSYSRNPTASFKLAADEYADTEFYGLIKDMLIKSIG